MGSFMARTILSKYPDSGITAAIICGTCWQPTFALPALIKVVEAICKKTGERNPNEQLQKMVFGGYNNRIENPRTASDWLTRDDDIVDAYVADPLCGFTPACGLLRDMMVGIHYIQQPKNLSAMKKDLPVYFVAGKEDPVGSYGKGVTKIYDRLVAAGCSRAKLKLYPQWGHGLYEEAGDFNDVVLAFLA